MMMTAADHSSASDAPPPDVSVVVVVHNIPAQAARTLLSLSPSYQRDIDPAAYEVIVVDNGSSPPVDAEAIAALPGPFRVIRIDPAPSSPAHAINAGLRAARGEVIGVMVDGARLATPGLLHFARHGARLYPQPVVVTLGWYLGADYQAMSALAGYDAQAEQALLERIGWPEDGYRLFEIGTPDESSAGGWFPHASPAAEPVLATNALFLRRAAWDALEGADERFDMPGGGLLNVDLYWRALGLPDARAVVLLGEATFHQIHGGIATNASPEQFRRKMRRWFFQYATLRGRPQQPPQPSQPPTYIGTLPPAALTRLVRGAIDPIRRYPLAPLGPAFDLWSWSAACPIAAAASSEALDASDASDASGASNGAPSGDAASPRAIAQPVGQIDAGAGASVDAAADAGGVDADAGVDVDAPAARANAASAQRRPAVDERGDPTLAALEVLMESEFRAGRYDAAAVVARIARRYAPDAPEPQRVLSIVAPYFDERGGTMHPSLRSAPFHLAIGRAYALTGDMAAAGAAFRLALDVDPACDAAGRALARLGRASAAAGSQVDR